MGKKRKQSVTIRAALITGGFAIIAAVIAGCFGIFSAIINKIPVPSSITSNKKSEYDFYGDIWLPENQKLLTPRSHFAAVAALGHVYAFGGLSDGKSTDSVEYAPIRSDGSIGAWQYTTPLNTRKFFLAVVYANGYFYAIGGGDDDGNVYSSVERATLLKDGSLSKWEVLNHLNTQRYALEAVSTNGYIYVISGDNGYNQVLSSIERAALNLDGSLGNWEIVDSINSKRANFAAVVSQPYLYVIGGWDASESIKDSKAMESVEWTTISPDGSLGDWKYTANLTIPTAGHAAVGAGGKIFVFGGDNRSQVLDTVQIAEINPDGSIIDWKYVRSLPQARTNLSAIYVDSIYLLGGSNQNIYNTIIRTK